MLATRVLYTEIINNEDKHDWAPFVSPESWCCVTLVVPMTKQTLGEEIVGELAGLFESVHAHAEFEVDPAVVFVLHEVVLVDDFLWHDAKLDAYILWSIERRVEVEVGKVKCHVLSPWCG